MGMLLFFSISIASFVVHFSIKPAYWFSNINQQFFNKPYTFPSTYKNGTAFTQTSQFMKIDTMESLNLYVKYFFTEKFLSLNSSDSPSFLNNKKILYGPYRIHTANVKAAGCQNGINIDVIIWMRTMEFS